MSTFSQTDTSSTTALIPSRKTYTRSGIGGAGNYKLTSPIKIHITQVKPVPRTIGTFLTGIGGSGNSRRYEERVCLSYEEQIARKRLIGDNAPLAYHHGIGGAGNCAATAFNGLRSSGDSSRGTSSRSSSGSQYESNKLKEKLTSHLKL